MDHQRFIALAVGNTRTRWGRFSGKELEDSAVAMSSSPQDVVAAVGALAGAGGRLPIIIASVNRKASDAIARSLESQGLDVARIGEDVAIPLRHALSDASTLGQDRALCALAAFARANQACAVIDAGTAITVDFVDGQGVFQGGVIAPGLSLMLRSLHEHTAALPALKPETPPDPFFGRDTKGAMLLGARMAARGLVRETIENFALHYGAYPQIIATGGDAASLFDADGLVEHIIPDLQLLGIAEAALADDAT